MRVYVSLIEFRYNNNTLHLQRVRKKERINIKVFLFSGLIMHNFFHKSLPI
jgi:hypothetical protein